MRCAAGAGRSLSLGHVQLAPRPPDSGGLPGLRTDLLGERTDSALTHFSGANSPTDLAVTTLVVKVLPQKTWQSHPRRQKACFHH